MRWMIEHRSLGAYLGPAPHPRTGQNMPLFRADNPRYAVKAFACRDSAVSEAQQIGSVLKMKGPLLSVLPLNR